MLKVECESCKAPYQVDERRVPDAGLKMRCPKCGHTFMVTDPSKASAGATPAQDTARSKAKATMVGVGLGAAPPPAPAAPSKAKATMMGVGTTPAVPPAVPKPEARVPALPFEEAVDLPAPAPAKAAPPRVPAAKPAAPPVPAAAPPKIAELPALDDLDLPALAGDVGLPAAGKRPPPRAPVPAAPPPPPPPPPPLALDADLPMAAGFGALDLPAAKGADLPAAKAGPKGAPPPPKAAGLDFGELDLPATTGAGLPATKGGEAFGALDLPQPKGRGRGFSDLPMPQDDLPLAGGAGLPALGGAGLPALGGAGLPALGGAGLPALGGNLPALGGNLPSVASGTGLPALAPTLAAGHAGGFGELDLPAVQDAPSFGSLDMESGSPRVAETVIEGRSGGFGGGGDSLGFGELDLGPSTPSSAPSGGGFGELDLPAGDVEPPPPSGREAGGGMGFGEVDLGGDPEAEQVQGPPPATSAGTFAFQEASLEAAKGPATGTRGADEPAPAKKASKAPLIAAGVLGLLVVGGAALQFTPVGAFGYVAFNDWNHKGEYAENAAKAGDDARKKLAVDSYAAAVAAADELGEARKRAPRNRPLSAYAAFVEFANQVRFGADPTRAARAQTYLADMPPETKVPYLDAALAAQAAAAGEWKKAGPAVERAMASEPADGIRTDLELLKAEIALAEKNPDAAIKAFTEAAKGAPTARTQFGVARAQFAAKNLPKANEALDQTLKLAPNHAGATTLKALVTWETSHEEAAALDALAKVLDEKNRKQLGASEISAALAARGTILLARDRAGEARAAFDEAVTIDPRNVSALIGQGEVLYADGRYTEALTRFDEAVQRDPANLAAVIGSAKTKVALERLADAKAQLAGARTRAPKDMAVALWAAKTEEALGNKQGAEALYGAAVELADPENPEAVQAYAAYASFLAAQGKAAEAQAKLEAAKAKLPDTPTLQRAFGEVASAQGKFDDAVTHYSAALEKNPQDLGTRFRLGVTYRKMRKLDLAAQEFDKVVAGDKDYPGIALERGLLFEEAGDLNKALEQFQSAFQKAPKDIDLMLRVGAAYVAVGKIEEALPLLNKVKDQRPNSAEANHFIGRAYLKQGGLETTQAMRFLQRAVELDPNRAEYHLYVAWGANESSPVQLGLARQHVDKALALDKLLADAYWQRGVVARREGAVNDAVKDLKRALELKPSRHEAHAALAECYEDRNEMSAAMAEWQKAIAGDGKQPYWHWKLGRLLVERGQTREAVSHLTFAVDNGKTAQPRPGWLAPAAFEAAEALRKSGQKAPAIEDYKLFMELSPPTSPDRRDALRALSDLGAGTP